MAGSGARAAVQKMASPSAAPWPTPSRSVHPAAVDSGANHTPASPTALTITAAGWTLLLGVGQGAALGLAIYCTTARAPDPVTAASLSAFAQGGGYLIATTGPLVFGFLHTAIGNWTVPVVALLGVYAAEFAVGLGAGRARTLPAPEPAA